MSIFMNIIMYVALFVLPITAVVAGTKTKTNPPKEINGVVGYRTKRSMASQEAWDYANMRMADLFIKNSVYMLALAIVALVILLATKSNYTNVRFTVIVIAVMLIQTMMLSFPMNRIEQELEDMEKQKAESEAVEELNQEESLEETEKIEVTE